MEGLYFEEEPYCKMSPVAPKTGHRARTKISIPNSSKELHIPLIRHHFIPTILTFDDW